MRFGFATLLVSSLLNGCGALEEFSLGNPTGSRNDGADEGFSPKPDGTHFGDCGYLPKRRVSEVAFVGNSHMYGDEHGDNTYRKMVMDQLRAHSDAVTPPSAVGGLCHAWFNFWHSVVGGPNTALLEPCSAMFAGTVSAPNPIYLNVDGFLEYIDDSPNTMVDQPYGPVFPNHNVFDLNADTAGADVIVLQAVEVDMGLAAAASTPRQAAALGLQELDNLVQALSNRNNPPAFFVMPAPRNHDSHTDNTFSLFNEALPQFTATLRTQGHEICAVDSTGETLEHVDDPGNHRTDGGMQLAGEALFNSLNYSMDY